MGAWAEAPFQTPACTQQFNGGTAPFPGQSKGLRFWGLLQVPGAWLPGEQAALSPCASVLARGPAGPPPHCGRAEREDFCSCCVPSTQGRVPRMLALQARLSTE